MLEISQERTPIGLYVADSEGRVIHVNDRWCEITGISAEEAKADGWRTIIHPEDLERLAADWLDAVKNRRPFKAEARYLRPDGRVVWFEADGSPVDCPETGSVSYIGSCIDITGRRKDESRARLYNAILSNNPDFAYVFDTGYRFIYANQALLTMWGRSWEEAAGLRCGELGYPDWHAEMHEREIDTVIQTRRPIQGEVFFHGTHGNRLYEYIFSPIFGEDGQVEAVAGVTRDVTERKQAEDRAHFLNELAGQLLPLTTDKEIMAEAVRMLGRHLDVQRCYFVECLKSENLVRVSRNWLRDGVTSTEGEFSLDSFGGDAWWARYSGGTFAVENVETEPLTMDRVDAYLKHEVRSFVTQPYRSLGPWTVVLAVTEQVPRKWSAEQLALLDNVMARVWPLVIQARTLETLRESDRRKDQFLATLAHELRNPLAPLLTGIDILRRAGGNQGMIDQVTGVIERQTKQMAHLIDDLLDISRINTGKINLRKEDVRLSQLLGNAVEAANPLIRQRRHQFEEKSHAGSTVIHVDAARVSQVITNLLSNAAKYTPEGGTLVLESGVDAGDVWIRVTDNGQGIEPEEQVVIFDLFHQTLNGSADGLGIGLTLVRALVEMHGGTVSVKSDGKGKGSEFEIRLHDCVASQSGTTTLPDSTEAAPPSKLVLVVDDNRSNADMLAMFLRMEGMEVATAYDGQEAFEKAREMKPHFVIMDIGMPVMDGLESARKMRESGINAVLVAFSGWGMEADKQRATEAGFDHHLTKPVAPAAVREVIFRK